MNHGSVPLGNGYEAIPRITGKRGPGIFLHTGAGGVPKRTRRTRALANRIIAEFSKRPVVEQAEVNVNMRYDAIGINNRSRVPDDETPYRPFPDGTRNPGANALRFELAFSLVSSVRRIASVNRNRNPNVHAVPVWTCFNGVTYENIRTNDLVFQGVVKKGYAAAGPDGNTINDLLQVTLSAGGSCTITNTGSETISAGDIVYWDFPDVHDGGPTVLFKPVCGVPPTKFVAKTVSKLDLGTPDDIKDIVRDLKAHKAELTTPDRIKTLVQNMAEVHRFYDTHPLTKHATIGAMGDTVAHEKDLSGTPDGDLDMIFALSFASAVARVRRSRVIGRAGESALRGNPFEIRIAF